MPHNGPQNRTPSSVGGRFRTHPNMTASGPPEEHALPEDAHTASSIVLVHTGDGKGKSTAAFGVMLRGIGRGWSVAVVQFLKSGEWRTGEEKVGRELGVDWWAIGEGFTWD